MLVLLQLNVIYSLELKKILIYQKIMIEDSQVYTALCIALLASVLAVRLGSTLYE
jgi:photosystem I reaction center subunit XII